MKVDEMRARRQRGQIRSILHPAGCSAPIASPAQRPRREADRMIKRRPAGTLRERQTWRDWFSDNRYRHQGRALPGCIHRIEVPIPFESELIVGVAIVEPNGVCIPQQEGGVGWLPNYIVEIR